LRESFVTVLVCGGRDFLDEVAVFDVLDEIHRKSTISKLVHGAARGADYLAGSWARNRGVTEVKCPADWSIHGKAAGPIRNRAMLRDYSPELVVAFPGGKGTADMLAAASAAGVASLRVGW
jgi:hypothetical protein